MKVKDLIESLKAADPDADIVMCTHDCCGHDIEDSISYLTVHSAWDEGKKKARVELHV